MVEKIKLVAKERELFGKKVKHLRKDGQMPAIIYGKDRKPLSLILDTHDFQLMHRTAGGNTIVDLEIEKSDGTKEKKNALIHQIDVDPVKGNFLHADLLQIKMNEKISASIPLHFTGDSEAVMTLGGSLLTSKDSVEVECLPAELPHEIEVDIAMLDTFESVIHVSDLKVNEGVIILDDPEEVIAKVDAPRSEEEMDELEAPVEEAGLPEAEHGTEEAEASEEQEKTEE